MHLTLVKIKLFVKLIKPCVSIPIYFIHIAARKVITVIRKFTRGAEILCLTVTAKHSGDVVSEDSLQAFKLADKPLIYYNFLHL